MSTPVLDTLLLLALPASGKSEVRRYLDHVPRDRRMREYHVGDTVQLDDFPYVHFMRMVDEALAKRGLMRRFYKGPEDGFAEPRDWGTLLHLVNDDYEVLADPDRPTPPADPLLLFERIDRARGAVGAPPVFSRLPDEIRAEIAADLQGEAERLVGEQFGRRRSLEGRTLVIEFARGGPEGADMPLPPPQGYRYALAQLHPDILARAAILYIWVTPEESRRKNLARANPDDPGSILHHSAPESVMRNDYGCDDMAWLIENSPVEGAVRIQAHGRTWDIPVARFDNRVDKTSFVRDDPKTWDEMDVTVLDREIRGALDRLWATWSRQHR